MPVDTKNPAYVQAIARWTRNRDVVEGEDKVKARGETYLPRLGKQTDPEYNAYKARASFFNATARTLDGLVGLEFRKPPAMKLPGSMKDWTDDIDLAGTPLADFAQRVARDDMAVGRAGILAEYPRAEIRERTADEAAAEGLRPYLAYYPAESILDWREGRVGNKTTLVFLKLYSTSEEEKPTDPWERVTVEWIRVYRLKPEGVTVETYRKDSHQAKDWTPQGTSIIVMSNAPAVEIPFTFIPDAVVEKAPLDDIVLANLSHYRTNADYENSAHWAASPTPVFIGDILSSDGQPVTEIRLGSSTGINLALGGDAKMLQATMEEGLGSVLDRKENQMAILGARILAGEKKQVEAAETAAIHRAGENSVLATRANAVSRAITKALGYMAAFAGVSGEISFQINTDYFPTPMTAQDLTALVKAWIDGAISMPELFDQLKQGEVIRTDKELTEHEAELEREKADRDDAAGDALAATAARMAQGGAVA